VLDNVAFPCTEIKAGGPSADRAVPTKASSQAKEKISADPVYIGLDSEWVQRGDHNFVLSVQLAMRHRGAEFPPRIFYTKPALEILRPGDPENRKVPDWLRLRSVIPEYIIEVKQSGFLTRWPKSVHLAAHWTRSDLPHFADFSKGDYSNTSDFLVTEVIQ
jgi:hypothetical protein